MSVRVQQAAFDPGAELNALHAANLGIGAVVGFVGYVRDFNDGHEVAGMFLEHAPGMTEKALQKIVAEAEQRCREHRDQRASMAHDVSPEIGQAGILGPTALPRTLQRAVG